MRDDPNTGAALPAHRAHPTISDVAARAGVSRSTASRALTGRGYAAADVKERVIAAATALGYVPDANARSLKARTTPTVGLLVSDLRNPFYAELAAGAASVLRSQHHTIVLVDDAGSDVDEMEAARTFLAMRVAGVLLTPVSAAATRYLLDRRVPVIEVDRQFCKGECDAVLTDNATAADDLTSYLIRLGHRRISLVIDETHWTTGAGRLRGYLAALERTGRPRTDESVVHCGFDSAGIAERVNSLLRSRRRPTAIFAANNLIAETTWREARALGLRIPADLSLTAFDDAAWMTMVDPGITTIAQPSFALGSRAAELLIRRMGKPARPTTQLLDSTFIERGSTARPPRRAAS